MVLNKILELFTGGNTLFYPGCMVKFVLQDIYENYRKILRKLGVDFIELKELELCCGSPALAAGYTEDFKKIVQKNTKVFKDHGVSRIITPCPGCYKILLQNYPGFRVQHISQVILEKGKLEKVYSGKITYHDPCHLGRHLDKPLYDEPREVLRKIGFEIVEMPLSRETSFCCGGGGGLRSNFPDEAKKISEERIAQAIKTGAKILITPCPMCYAHLKESAKGIEVKELSQVVLDAI